MRNEALGEPVVGRAVWEFFYWCFVAFIWGFNNYSLCSYLSKVAQTLVLRNLFDNL
jgi:hypothetical protein